MYKTQIGGELIPNRIFVGGIPETSDNELREYFYKICDPAHIVDVKYMENFKGSSKGICFVTFNCENEVAKFLNLNSNLVFKNVTLKISNAYRRYNNSNNYSKQSNNYTQQSHSYNNQADMTYYASPNAEDSELCIMTPTPPIAQIEPTNTDNVNEMASSSSASSASSNFQVELNVDVNKKPQAISTSSASSVTGVNSELTTLTRINSTEKESSCFSSSSSSSSTASSKSASISNLNKSNEVKSENQNLDSNNNNKNTEQKGYKKQNDSFRLNYGQNRPQNYQRMNSLNQKPYRYNSNYSGQNEPLTIQTSNQRTYHQMASPYYYTHSNPISPIKMGQKQNQKQNLQQRNNKNSDILKINANMNASNYVGSVIGSIYPDNKTNEVQISSNSTKNFTQNGQSQSNVAAAAAEAIANYANQTGSVNSSSILNIAGQNMPRQNPNFNVYPGDFMTNQTKTNSNLNQTQPQVIYPNFYYYTNPSLPVNQSNIYVDPNVQKSVGPLTPQSYTQYYQAQAGTINNTENQSHINSQTEGNSQSTISNAFETATGNQNMINHQNMSVEQLDDMMQKSLNLNQYDSHQYSSQPIYYVAHLPNSQYYTYYYTPTGPVLGPNPNQSQVQLIAPMTTSNTTQSAPSAQTTQSYSNQPSLAQQQLIPHLYMQQQMMSGSLIPSNAQPMPILQIPTISYYNSNQQPVMSQAIPQGQQYQFQQLSQTSPQQNSYPINSQIYQYSSGITPKGSIMNQNNIQNRLAQNSQNSQRRQNQKQSSQTVNKTTSYTNRQPTENQTSVISPIVKMEANTNIQ